MRPRFGFCAPIFAAPGNCLFRTPNYPALDTAVTMGLSRQADALGYDSLWVADHLMLGRDEAIAAFATGATDQVPPALGDAFLIGTPEQIEARLRTYLGRVICRFLLWFMDAPDPAGMQLFARELVPRFR